jgi:acetylornithine/N-succinyldiaminopimelate aminotransferase
MSQSLMATYKRLDVTFSKGEGSWLWDKAGKRYLDAISGIAVCSLGHAHPAVTSALCEQASTLVHTSNIYGIENQQRLGDALTSLSEMDRVFFSNSGAEANEAAIKLARLHGHRNNIKDPAIVVMENSFHGRTLATLTATGNRKVQAGFEPLVQGFMRVPYGDIEALEALAEKSQNIAAVLVEPVQGEGGVNIPAAGYLSAIRKLCDDNNWLMMLDEIQTGMGRTGTWFAWQHEAAKPDVMTVAKALGNGVPIGACLAHGEAAGLFAPGSHGSTFGGNPLVCAAALAVVDTMQKENIPARAKSLGDYLANGFTTQLDVIDAVVDIRHAGCLLGIQLDRPCTELVSMALERGLLINVTADAVIRLLPPLNMSNAEADILIEGLSQLIKESFK